MPSKKTIKTSAKWPDNVFEEFISSGMKLHDLLDEDLQAKDYSWHQMRRLCDHYQVTTGGTKEDMALRLRLARDDAIAATALDDDEEQPQPPAPTQHVDLSADADEDDAPAEDVAAASAATNSSTIAAHQQEIVDLDSKIDELKREFSRDLDEKLGLLKSPNPGGGRDIHWILQ